MNAERRSAVGFALALLINAAGATETEFSAAMLDYEQHRHQRAFDALARLADGGHAEAARIALLMVAQGPRLYGRRFEIDAVRRERWLDAATTRAELNVAAQRARP